jgi:hypothetical protein
MTYTLDEFEGGYDRDARCYPHDGEPYDLELGNVMVPKGWQLWYKHWYKAPLSWDKTNKNGWSQPESHGVNAAYPYRIHAGESAFCGFTYGRIGDWGLMRRQSAIIGHKVTASVYVHAWSSLDSDDPKQSTGVGKAAYFAPAQDYEFGDDDGDGFVDRVHVTGDTNTDALANATFYIGIDPTGGKDPNAASVVWSLGYHVYNVYAPILITTTAQAEKVSVFIRFLTLWQFKHNDAYIDHYEFTCDETEPEPEEPEEPGEPPVVVVGGSPQSVTAVWADLPQPEDMAPIDTFFDVNYPACEVFHIIGSDVEPEEPEEPEPEEPEQPAVTLHPLGFHVQDIIGIEEQFKSYVEHVKPGIIKIVGNPGLAKTIKELSPETRVVYRHYATAKEQDAYLNAMNAGGWVELLARDIAGWEQYIDFVESLNEVLKSNDAANMTQVVEFERGFISALRVLGVNQKPMIFCAAVGNPHESQFADMIPAVRELVEAGGAIGYHAYWWANKDADGLLDWWPYHAGRWQEMDRAFAAAGLKPLYILGEAGVLGSKDGGEHLLPEDGWREWMELPEYLEDLQIFTDLVDEWNEEHGGRCLGAALFTLNKNDWKSFNFRAGELSALEDAVQ